MSETNCEINPEGGLVSANKVYIIQGIFLPSSVQSIQKSMSIDWTETETYIFNTATTLFSKYKKWPLDKEFLK